MQSGVRKGTIKLTASDPKLIIEKPNILQWELPTASRVELELVQNLIDWLPPKDTTQPQSIEIQLSKTSPPLMAPLQLSLTSLVQPLPGAADAIPPYIQFFADQELKQLFSDKTKLTIPAPERKVKLWWRLNSTKPTPGDWKYTLHLQSLNPDILLAQDKLNLTIRTAVNKWNREPPGLITARTRVWPFELFASLQSTEPADPKQYKFIYQFGNDGPTIQGNIRAAVGERALILSAADELPLLTDEKFKDYFANNGQPTAVVFKLIVNGEKGREVETWKTWVDAGAIRTASFSAQFTPTNSSPRKLTFKPTKDGVQQAKITGAGEVDLDFTSIVKVPLQGGPHEVLVRRLFILRSLDGPLDDVLLERLKEAAKNPDKPTSGISIFTADKTAEYQLPDSADSNDPLSVAPPVGIWPVPGRVKQRRIIEQIVLEDALGKDGMEEWQETRLEFAVSPIIPLSFYLLVIAAVAVLGVLAYLVAALVMAARARRRLAVALKQWLHGHGEVMLQSLAGESFQPASADGDHIGQFTTQRPHFRGLSSIGAWFASRSAQWAAFQEPTTDDSPGKLHYIGLAFSRRGLELCCSLPGNCNTQDGGQILPGKWLLIDEFGSPEYRALEIGLALPASGAATQAAAEPADDDGPTLAPLGDENRQAQFSLEWWRPKPVGSSPPSQRTTSDGGDGPSGDPPDDGPDDYGPDSGSDLGGPSANAGAFDDDLSNIYSDPEDSFQLQEPSDSSTRLS